jgi:hypothetical protein
MVVSQFKKHARIYFFLLFSLAISCDVQAASVEGFLWNFWNTFECCSYRNVTSHVMPMQATNHLEQAIETRIYGTKKQEPRLYVSPSKELTVAAGQLPFVKRDQVDAKTRAEIFETIEKMKIKWAPVPVNAHENVG